MRLHSALVRFCRAGAVWLAIVAMPDGVAAPCGAMGIAPPPPYKAPYTPTDDDALLQEVPSASDPAVRQMRRLRGELDADDSSLVIAEQLAPVSYTHLDVYKRQMQPHPSSCEPSPLRS